MILGATRISRKAAMIIESADLTPIMSGIRDTHSHSAFGDNASIYQPRERIANANGLTSAARVN